MREASRIGWILVLSAGATACVGSEQVDLGNDRATGLGAQLSDYAGAWQGYAEAFNWNDDSDSVRVDLDENGAGVIEVGEAGPLPEPDPDHAPAGLSPADEKGIEVDVRGLVAGFSYPVYSSVVEAQRIRFNAHPSDLYEPWCELQTPMLDVDAMPAQYNCLGHSGFMFDPMADQCTVGDEQVDCGKLSCLQLCQCTEDACTATDQSENVLFDGALQSEGQELVGTLVVDGQRVTVRLSR